MRRPDLSAYRLAQFEVCPKAHRYAYLEGRPRRAVTAPALLRAFAKGKALHGAIEDAGKARRVDVGLSAVPTADELQAYVDARAIRHRLSAEDHEDTLAAAVEALPVLDLGGQLVDPEFWWACEVAPGILAEGRYDCVVQRDGRVVTRDWKCGHSDPPTSHEAAYFPQVGLYLIDLHARWPEASGWEVELVHVRKQAVVRVAWTPGLDRLWRGRAAAAVRAWRRGYSPAVVDDHCRRCDFRDECQSWLALQGQGVEDPAVELGDEALLEERKRTALLAALFKDRKIECDKALRKRMRGTDRMSAGGLQAALRKTERDQVAAEAVVALASHRGEDVAGIVSRVASISSRKLARALRSDFERQLVAKWSSKRTSTHVEVRKARGAL